MDSFEEMEARAQKATPGPWKWTETDRYSKLSAPRELVLRSGWTSQGYNRLESYNEISSEDADLIEHAPDILVLTLGMRKLAAALENLSKGGCAAKTWISMAIKEATHEINNTQGETS